MNLILYIFILLIFFVIWVLVTALFLPINVIGFPDGNKRKDSKYDERQAIMITEVLARTFVMVVFALIFNIISRVFGFASKEDFLLNQYPEIMYLIIGFLFAIFNYIIVKKRY